MNLTLSELGHRRLRFVSDMHLGHEKSAIRNLDRARFLLDDCDTLVVCGDMSEARGSLPGSREVKMHDDWLAMCREAGVELISLAGNHDPMGEDRLEIDHGSLVAFHGHCLFKEGSPWSRDYLDNKDLFRALIDSMPQADVDLNARMELARKVALLDLPDTSEAVERMNGRNRLLREIYHVFWPPARPWQIMRARLTLRSRIRRFRRQFLPNAKVVCFGHFHKRDVFRSENCLFVNLGAYFQYGGAYVMDLVSGRIQVREVSMDRGWGKIVDEQDVMQG